MVAQRRLQAVDQHRAHDGAVASNRPVAKRAIRNSGYERSASAHAVSTWPTAAPSAVVNSSGRRP